MKFKIFWIFFAALLFLQCRKEPEESGLQGGQIVLHFEHRVNGNPLQTDTLLYVNAAGNPYMVTEVMYFISDIAFYHRNGSVVNIDDWKDIFYIDTNIPSTLTQILYDRLPPGRYDSVSFIFGITGEKNISFMYPNPPEVNMAWPEVLGGGYHYMMLNGRWLDTAGVLRPFDFHLGIGQLYKSNVINVDSIYAYVQNWFRVSLPGSSFLIDDGEIKDLTICMNIESWFETPHVYDHNRWGGSIMQNQPAMQMARENGKDVFDGR